MPDSCSGLGIDLIWFRRRSLPPFCMQLGACFLAGRTALLLMTMKGPSLPKEVTMAPFPFFSAPAPCPYVAMSLRAFSGHHPSYYFRTGDSATTWLPEFVGLHLGRAPRRPRGALSSPAAQGRSWAKGR